MSHLREFWVNIPREFWANNGRAIVFLIKCELEGGGGVKEVEEYGSQEVDFQF